MSMTIKSLMLFGALLFPIFAHAFGEPYTHRCAFARAVGKKPLFQSPLTFASINVFSAMPTTSWKWGLNENTNGLLRQHFPKGTLFDTVTEEEVQAAVTALNHRPRKVLGYRTPHEVFFGKEMRYTASAQAVALQT